MCVWGKVAGRREAGLRPPLLSCCARKRFRDGVAKDEGPGRSGGAGPGGAQGRMSELEIEERVGLQCAGSRQLLRRCREPEFQTARLHTAVSDARVRPLRGAEGHGKRAPGVGHQADEHGHPGTLAWRGAEFMSPPGIEPHVVAEFFPFAKDLPPGESDRVLAAPRFPWQGRGLLLKPLVGHELRPGHPALRG